MVTFYRPQISIRELKKIGGLGEGDSEGLNEGLKSLVEVIKENPGIKAKDASVRLQRRPIKTLERQIKSLIGRKLIERRGSRKTGGYWLASA